MLRAYSTATDTSLAGLIGQRFGYGYSDSLGTIVGMYKGFQFQFPAPTCRATLHELSV